MLYSVKFNIVSSSRGRRQPAGPACGPAGWYRADDSCGGRGHQPCPPHRLTDRQATEAPRHRGDGRGNFATAGGENARDSGEADPDDGNKIQVRLIRMM